MALWYNKMSLSVNPKSISCNQFSSAAQLCLTLCDPKDCSTPGLPVHHQLPEFTQAHVHELHQGAWWCHPTVSSSVAPFSSRLQSCPPLGSFPMSQLFASGGQRIGASISVLPMTIQGWFPLGWTCWISLQSKGLSRVFFNTTVWKHQFFVIRWPKYWSFSFSISPSNEYSGLISFRMDLLDLHAVQGTLKSLFQHHSSKASILWHSAFFIVQLSCPYVTTGKTIALTRWTFVGKVMSLLCSMLCRLVTAFLPRSKCLLISWLQSPSAVILEPPK